MPLDLFTNDLMRWVALLIVVDWVLGVVAAVAKNEFKLHMVAYYLGDAVLPYVFGFALVQLLASAHPDLQLIVPVTFIAIAMTLLGNILANLGKLGLPVPKFCKKT